MFRFHSPYWFLLLLPLLGLLVRRYRSRAAATALFSDVRPLRDVPRTRRQRLLFLPPFLFQCGLLLLVVALARPQAGREENRIRSDGIAIAFCLDRSGSMRALDFQIGPMTVTRLEAAKKTFRDFVLGNDRLKGRTDDMISLIAFGGFVDTYCPLTLDHETLVALLDQVRIPAPTRDASGRIVAAGFFEEEAKTAIGDAIAQAVDRLREYETKGKTPYGGKDEGVSKIVVLLSDGEQTAGVLTPQEGAEIAKRFGIKIYTIGIGTTGIVPVEETLADGRVVYRKQPVALDEATLRRIAETTDGRYFNAQNTETLEKVYEEIDRLEKSPFEDRAYSRYAELYPRVLIPAILLLVLSTLLSTTVLRTFP